MQACSILPGMIERGTSIGEGEVRIYPPTSLRSLGIEAPSDRFHLSEEDLILVKLDSPEGSIYLGLLKHPFSGGHFTHMLYEVSPFIGGEEGDWTMPDNARKQTHPSQEGDPAWLHHIHTTDPYIGPAYNEFDLHHRVEWLNQENDHRGNGPLYTVDSIRFITDLRTYGMEIFQRFLDRCNAGDNDVFGELNGGATWTRQYRLGNLGKFRLAQVEEIPWRHPDAGTYLSSLNDDQRVSVGLGEAIGQNNEILFEINSGSVYAKDMNIRGKNLDFTGDSVIISDKETVAWYRVKSGEYVTDSATRGTLDGYQLPQHYYTDGIYPLFAWRKDPNGQRRFLSQPEIAPIVARMDEFTGIKSDVALGRIMSTFFTEPVRAGLEREIELMHGRRPQKMMTGQVAALVSLYTIPGYHGQPERPGPATQLLSGEYPLFPSMERYAA